MIKLCKKCQVSKIHLFFFLLVLFSSFQLFSQNSDFSDDAVIVVSAGKIEQNVEDASEKVQVISSGEIRDSGAKTLSEAVKNLPGVTVKGASGGNPVDSISMQGFDSSYVKILVDGVAVTGDLGGSTAVFEIPVEMIDHIEVVQGASSALYGSDAMGGVINIITKKAEGEGGETTFHASFNEEFSCMKSGNWRNYASATASAAGEHLSSVVTASFDYTPGKEKSAYYALAGGNINYFETPRKRLGFVRGSLDWTDGWGKIGAYGLFSDSLQKSNFTATGFNTGATMEYATKRIEGGLNGEYAAGDSLLFSGFSSVKNYKLDTSYDVKAGEDSSVTDTDSDFLDWESEIRASYDFNDFNKILIGVNGNLETIKGDSFDGRKKQLLLSAYAQDTLSLFDERLSVVPGLRFDFVPEIDGAEAKFMLTPKVSLKYSPTEDTAIRFAYGMGYKTASLKQKHWIFYHNYASGEGNFILYGNPDLESEKSQSFNLSLEQKIADFKISAGGYFNFIKDMITSVVTDSTTSPQKRTYENVDKAITYGGEASLSYKIERFDAKAGYACTQAKAYDKESGDWEELSLRVNHRITAGANYLVPRLEAKVGLSVEWNSRQRVTAGKDEWTPDYLMLCANLSKTFWDEKIEAYIRGDNLLNNKNFKDGTDGQNQEEYFGLKDGTTVSVGVRVKL